MHQKRQQGSWISEHTTALSWVIVVIALMVGGAGVWIPSFWGDEAASLQLARLPLDQILRFTGHLDGVHATYAIVLHGVIGTFGESELTARAASVVGLALATGGVFALTRRWGGGVLPAVFAATVFMFLPRVLIQAGEARSYGIGTAILVLAMLLVVWAGSSHGWQAGLLWVAAILAATLGIYLFAYTALVLPALGVAAASGPLTRRQRTLRFALVAGVPALLSIPLALVMLTERGQLDWVADVAVTPGQIIIDPFFGGGVWLAVLFVAIVTIGVVRGGLLRDPHIIVLLLWMLLPAALLAIISLTYQPVFLPRYLTMSTPAVAIIAGLSVRTLRPRQITAWTIAWALAAVPFLIFARVPTAKPGGIDFRAIASAIHDGSEPGDGFLLVATGPNPLRPRIALAAYPQDFARLDDLALVTPFPRSGSYKDIVLAPDAVDLDHVHRVWVATRGEDPFAAVLEAKGFTRRSDAMYTGILVALWTK